MNPIKWLIDNAKRLRETSTQELGRWGRIAQGKLLLVETCGRRLRQDNAGAMSAALSFRTIFAMIPILALAFLMLKSVGVVEDRKKVLNELMRRSGLDSIVIRQQSRPQQTEGPPPAEADKEKSVSVSEYVLKLWQRVEQKLTFGRLGPIGVLLLVWTALTLLTTIEHCLNRIFRAARNRPLVNRITAYWTSLTLGPVMLVGAIYAAEKISQLGVDVPVLSWLFAVLSLVAPAVVGIIALAAIYILMPNTRVPVRHALAGATLAVPLWMLTRWAFFSLYVSRVGLQSLYGALGLIPLFMLWLNLSWWIFLFGAELAGAQMGVAESQRADNPNTPTAERKEP